MKLIKTESGIIAVSEEQPISEDIVITKNNSTFHEYMALIGVEHNKENCFKVVASTFNPKLFTNIFYDELPKLKFSSEVAAVLGVWDVKDEMITSAFNTVKDSPNDLSSGFKGGYSIGFIDGFTSRAELSANFKFTLEDLRKAIDLYREFGLNVDKTLKENVDSLKNAVIQSLREYEVETYEKTEDTLTILKLK